MIGSGMALLLTAVALVLTPANGSDGKTLATLIDYVVERVKLTVDPDRTLLMFLKSHEIRDPNDPLSVLASGLRQQIWEAILEDPQHVTFFRGNSHLPLSLEPTFLGFHSGGWKSTVDDFKEANLTISDVVPVPFGALPDGVSAADIKKEFGMDPDDPLFVVTLRKDSQTYKTRKDPEHQKNFQEYFDLPLYPQPDSIAFRGNDWKKLSAAFKETNLSLGNVRPAIFGNIPEVDEIVIKKEFGMKSGEALFKIPPSSPAYKLEKF